jgi:dTDP-4-amino-4,6-dideoxygalactose transaminase
MEEVEQRKAIEQACEKANIDCRRIWKPMHQQPLFRNNLYFGVGNSDYLFEYGLCLPSSSNLTDQQFTVIRETILTVFCKF